MTHPSNRTARRDKRFFDALRAGNGVTKAAEIAGYCRRSTYVYKDNDEEFRLKWEDAKAEWLEELEVEADRRAKEGTMKKVFYQGKECGEQVEYSDNLLMFRLKALDPEKYRDRQEVKHDGEIKNTAPVINLVLNGRDQS